MKAEERKALESNDLASGAATLFDGVKTGHLGGPAWGYRVAGLTASALLIGGLVWYLFSENRGAASRAWATLDTGNPSQIDDFVKQSGNTLPGQVARLEQARKLLGDDGIGKLTATDREAQNKAIANIEKARDLFVQLAGELAKDKTLHASCLCEVARAELALVGIPKTANGPESRGTVQAAAEFYTKAAAAIGVATPAGEQFTKKAADLTANDATLTKAALDLYSRTVPTPAFDGSRPGAGSGILAPKSIEPKTDLTPAEGVKPPLTPIVPPTPPVVLPVAPPVVAPVAPPAVTPVAPATPPVVVPAAPPVVTPAPPVAPATPAIPK